MSGLSTIEQDLPEPAKSASAAPPARPNEAELNEHRRRAVRPVANDNTPTPPIIVLHPMGDGALLYRTLASVLVRRELTSASAIREADDREASHSST